MSKLSLKEESQEELKLEDVLKSIRGIIDDHNSEINSNFEEKSDISSKRNDNVRDVLNYDSDVLELTDLIEPDFENKGGIISDNVKKITEKEIEKFSKRLSNGQYVDKEDDLNKSVDGLIRPLLKEWMDNNLPRIVERVVVEEIKKIIPKK